MPEIHSNSSAETQQGSLYYTAPILASCLCYPRLQSPAQHVGVPSSCIIPALITSAPLFTATAQCQYLLLPMFTAIHLNYTKLRHPAVHQCLSFYMALKLPSMKGPIPSAITRSCARPPAHTGVATSRYLLLDMRCKLARSLTSWRHSRACWCPHLLRMAETRGGLSVQAL